MPHPGSNEASALRGGALQIWTKNVAGKAGKGNSYRAVIGFCRQRLRQGPGCTERASRLLFCGEGWLIGRAQGTGNKSYRGAVGFWGYWPVRGLAAQNALPGFFSVVKGSLQGVSRAQVKSPTEASRILGLVACQETWLHRTRFPTSFLW